MRLAQGVPGNPYPVGSYGWTAYNYSVQKGQPGYGSAGGSGSPVTMIPLAPSVVVAPAQAPVIRTTTGVTVPASQQLSPAVSAPAAIHFSGGGSGGGFDVSGETVSQADLIAQQQAKAAAPAGGSAWLLLLAAAAAALGST